jgi:NADH-quinone oxidoreductase subunit A
LSTSGDLFYNAGLLPEFVRRHGRASASETFVMSTSVSIVAYLALFGAVGFAFLLVNLLVGKLVRPRDPLAEKLEIYECGEPTIGSSFVQFDLRFYVVALLFIIFDVEIAFFFPWATVFGKATNLATADATVPLVQRVETSPDGTSAVATLDATGAGMMAELGWTEFADAAAGDVEPAASRQVILTAPGPDAAALSTNRAAADEALKASARKLSWISMADIAVFFAVLLVGFAYVWMRGDLNWVRAVGDQTSVDAARGPPADPSARQVAVSA